MAKGPFSKTKTKKQILQDVISLLTHRPLFALSPSNKEITVAAFQIAGQLFRNGG